MQKFTWPVAAIIIAAIAGIVAMYYFVPESDGQTRSLIITAVIGVVSSLQLYFTRRKDDGKDDE